MLHALLYDAEGQDREVTLDDPEVGQLDGNRLLWVDALSPTDEELEALRTHFPLYHGSLSAFAREDRLPRLDSYGEYFQFDVDTVIGARRGSRDSTRMVVHTERLHVICGERFVMTVHRAPLALLEVFRRQDKGETRIGVLTGPAFAVSLLDWHLGSFFDAVERVEDAVDDLDDDMLELGKGRGRATLHTLAALRRKAAFLRRLLASQREVVYGLSRPDFALIVGERTAPHVEALTRRYDRALDAVEATRELVLGSFDLFATRTAQGTNELVRTLTFVTLLLGGLGVVAGVFGMNFPIEPFETRAERYAELAFAGVLLGMVLIAAVAVYAARRRGWLSGHGGEELDQPQRSPSE